MIISLVKHVLSFTLSAAAFCSTAPSSFQHSKIHLRRLSGRTKEQVSGIEDQQSDYNNGGFLAQANEN